MVELRSLWDDVVPGADALAEDLVARYGDARRQVFREQYVEVVLGAVAVLEQLATDPTAVRLAAWYHRAGHAPGATSAEDAEASARMAEEQLPTYGVSPARTAEVARLVRLTGTNAGENTPDPNGDVLRDAVNAVIADEFYPTHTAEVRRDADQAADADETRDSGQTWVRQRYDDLQQQAAAPIYRTQLARDRYDADARANLARELTQLDALLPANWRGWQRAALLVTAVLAAFVAFMAAFGASRAHWREPAYSGDPSWPAIVLTVLALAAVPALSWAPRRTGRLPLIIGGASIATGVIGLIYVWIKAPATNISSGVGQGVPLMVIASILLIVAGAAAFGASRFPGRPRNRGQVLAGLGAAAVMVVLTVFVIDPLQTRYLQGANERLVGQHEPAGSGVRSRLAGGVLWTAAGSVADVVTTSHGIAIGRSDGAVEMLDPATGKLRWRYSRTDTSDQPVITVLGGGAQLLVKYDDLGYFVLDADTGKRLKAWPGRTRDYEVQNADPLVTGLSVSKGSDKLFGTDPDGSNRWTYAPGRCTSITAVATADTVVTDLSRSCGGSDETVGLNLKDGKKLWSHSGSALNWDSTVGGLIVGTEGTTALVGLEARSGTEKWRWAMPKEWGCAPRGQVAGNLVVLVSCPRAAGEAHTHSIVTAIDGDTGRPVWTVTVPVSMEQRYEVTADGRVLLTDDQPGSCRLVEVAAGQVRYVPLPKPIRCGAGVAAAGDLVVVGGEGATIMALR